MREPKKVKIQDGDREITLVITPMGAVKAERWLTKALLSVGGILYPLMEGGRNEDVLKAMAELDYDKVGPLWDELLTCCAIDGFTLDMETLDGKIDYPTTVFAIKVAALKANFGFFGGDGWRKFLSSMRGAPTSQRSEA